MSLDRATRSTHRDAGPSRSLLGLSLTLVSCAGMMATGLVGLLGVFGLATLAPLAGVVASLGQPLLVASLALTILGLARRGARIVASAALAAVLVYSSMYVIPDPETLALDEMMGMFGSATGWLAALSTWTFLAGLCLLVAVFVTAYWPARFAVVTGAARATLAGLAALAIVSPGLYLALAAPLDQTGEAGAGVKALTESAPVGVRAGASQRGYLEEVLGYTVVRTWGQPGGEYGLLVAIPSDPTLEVLMATGAKFNQAFADETRVTVMIFDDAQAAGVFFDSMMGSGSDGDEAEAASHWKGTYEKDCAEAVHRLEVWLDPDRGPFETVAYDAETTCR